MTDTKQCPMIGCEERHGRHLFCCRRHWFALPKPLRDAIWATVGKDWIAWAKNGREAVLYIAAKEQRDCAATEFDRLAGVGPGITGGGTGPAP